MKKFIQACFAAITLAWPAWTVDAASPSPSLHPRLVVTGGNTLVVMDAASGASLGKLVTLDWPNPRLRVNKEHWLKENKAVVAEIGWATKMTEVVIASMDASGTCHTVEFKEPDPGLLRVETERSTHEEIKLSSIGSLQVAVIWLHVLDPLRSSDKGNILSAAGILVSVKETGAITVTSPVYKKLMHETSDFSQVLDSFTSHRKDWSKSKK